MPDVKHYNYHGYPVGKQTKGSSGFDLHILYGRTIMPGETHVVGTGSHFEIPDGFEGQVTIRSSYGKMGLVIPNSPGIIDSDYRGEVKIVLTNVGNTPVEIAEGHRIAQIRFSEVPVTNIIEVQSLDDLGKTTRGAGGFGSTGNV